MPQKRGKFIREQRAEFSKIYCFISFPFWRYELIKLRASQGMAVLNNKEIPDHVTQDDFFSWG